MDTHTHTPFSQKQKGGKNCKKAARLAVEQRCEKPGSWLEELCDETVDDGLLLGLLCLGNTCFRNENSQIVFCFSLFRKKNLLDFLI